MSFFNRKPKEVCQVHGNHGGHGNRMLIGMTLAAFALIAWHVWVFGSTANHAMPGESQEAFPLAFANELLDLLFNKKGILAELREVFPYFIAGVLIAGYLRTFKVAVKLQMHLRKYGVASVFLASFIGIITPLCACGTLTTAISLLFAGIPLAPVMALMVTSPLLSPSTYLITLNDLGPEWTVIRTLSAYSMGIFAGLTTHYISKKAGFKHNEIFTEGAIIRGDFHDDDYPDERLRCDCRRTFGNRVAVRTGNKFLIFLAKSYEMLWTVGKYIIVGVVIGAVVERYMPSEWIYGLFGRKDPLSILWVTLASVPMFLHQLSASSILSHIKSSLGGTLDAGAALAFMVGGPVTAVPTMVLFWTFFKKRIFALYMFVCLAGTLLIAYTFQFIVLVPGVDFGNPLLRGVGSLTGGASSVITKQSPNAKMVMDPGGKGIIATYSNDLEGGGAIVFDASPARFGGADEAKHDNRIYIRNIADWLEQSNNSDVRKRITVYGNSAVSPLGGAALAELAKEGFAVKVVSRSESPRLTEPLLADCSQLWFFSDGSSPHDLNDEELKLIERHNSKSGGILLVAAAQTVGGGQGINKIASQYGVRFDGAVDNAPQLKVSVASTIFNQLSKWLGQGLKVVNKA